MESIRNLIVKATIILSLAFAIMTCMTCGDNDAGNNKVNEYVLFDDGWRHTNLYGQFIIIDKRCPNDMDTLYITYDKDTKVEYYIIESKRKRNSITPIYNTDGTIKVYGDEKNDKFIDYVKGNSSRHL